MAAKLVKTSTPGIYRRHATTCDRNGRCGCSYVVVYDGKARTFGTMDEAREGKRLAHRQAKLSKAHAVGLHRDEPRGECPDCEREREAREGAEPLLHDYAREVIARYIGTGRRGYREETRDEDRRLLERYALAYFAPDVRLRDVGPMQIAEFIGWLCRQPSRRGGTLADRSVRNALKPVRIVLATVRREGLIAHNPASEAVLLTARRLTMTTSCLGRSLATRWSSSSPSSTTAIGRCSSCSRRRACAGRSCSRSRSGTWRSIATGRMSKCASVCGVGRASA